jgi:hypothetical protein
MKQAEKRARRGFDSPRLHHRHIVERYTSVSSVHCRGRKQCVYDGADMVSIDGSVSAWTTGKAKDLILAKP